MHNTQPTRLTDSHEERMEGEREGDQGCDSWKPQREVQRECDFHNAARSFSTPQGVARQERVQPKYLPKRRSGDLRLHAQDQPEPTPPREQNTDPKNPTIHHTHLGQAPSSTKHKG